MAVDRDFEQATERQADALKAERAYERAQAWARSTDGRTYSEMFPEEETRDDRA